MAFTAEIRKNGVLMSWATRFRAQIFDMKSSSVDHRGFGVSKGRSFYRKIPRSNAPLAGSPNMTLGGLKLSRATFSRKMTQVDWRRLATPWMRRVTIISTGSGHLASLRVIQRSVAIFRDSHILKRG